MGNRARKPERVGGVFCFLKGQGTVSGGDLKYPSSASVILSHVMCAVRVLIFHDFRSTRCSPPVCLRALLLPSCAVGHQGDLVDIVSS